MDDHGDDQFNDALEAMLHDDRSGIHALDPEMGATIDQLYGWAELSGFATEPATEIAFIDGQVQRHNSDSLVVSIAPMQDAEPREPRTGMVDPQATPVSISATPLPLAPPSAKARQHRSHSLMSIFSGIAAILLIGFAAYGAWSHFPDQVGNERPTEITFGAGGTAVIAPSPTPHPTTVPNPAVAYAVPPLSADGCAAPPRSRNDLLAILSTPPAADPGKTIGSTTADAETRGEIDKLLRSWWTCRTFGKTWGKSAYESKQYIREEIYPNPMIATAFSPGTLNELLNSQSQIDATQRSMFAPDVNGIPTIAPGGAVWITPKDSPGPRAVLAQVVLVSATTGEALGGTREMYFVYEDGSWKIRSDDPRKIDPSP